MFCPSCKDEFRPGFTHCANCDVDLVESLQEAASPGPQQREAARPAVAAAVRMADYCGFFSLDEARDARDRVGGQDIRADILIRESASDAAGTVREEYWLRVDTTRVREAAGILEAAVPAAEELGDDEESILCPSCETLVAAAESFCPQCGARFADDR